MLIHRTWNRARFTGDVVRFGFAKYPFASVKKSASEL